MAAFVCVEEAKASVDIRILVEAEDDVEDEEDLVLMEVTLVAVIPPTNQRVSTGNVINIVSTTVVGT